MKYTYIALSFTLFGAACATSPPADQAPAAEAGPSATERAIVKTQDGFGEAALSPLEDVNLKRAKIPEKFKQIKNPYLVAVETPCEKIAEEVLELDALLGRDWDIPPPDKKGLSDRAADGASTAFLDTVASGASGLIPYRGIVRTVTGANSHATKVRKAYERGSHRRTFLKGIGLAKGCDYPASPLPPVEEESKIQFR
ncbi:MAG: hypothetical protein NXH78_02580 [Hyphomonadaceae bacterium]|nr:hypothetical protein [Hyphomonadaceae bacterium]